MINEENKDFADFIDLLNKNKVDYCIIGAYAVAFHARPRYTKDIDILVSVDRDNAKNVYKTLREFGIDDPALNEDILKEKGKIFRIGDPPNRLEILNDIDGVDVLTIMKNKVPGHYGSKKTFYIGIEELIKNKEASGKKEFRKDSNDMNDFKLLLKFKASKK